MLTPSFLLVAVILSLSHFLLVSADPPLNVSGVPPPSPVNGTRSGKRHRGHRGIQANVSLLNVSGSVPPIKKTNQFLDTQNAIRAGVGEPPLVWDYVLARYARNWANGRVADCKMLHSDGPYGENIFWGGRDHWTPTQIVHMWVDEVKDYDPVSNTCRDGEICGHYTQVVWRDTAKVGCARVTCNNGGMFAICVYDPPGNYIGESPFGHSLW